MTTGHAVKPLSKERYFKLITDLNHVQVGRRLSALGELAASGDPRAPGPASRRLFDADPTVRELAGRTLTGHGLEESATTINALYREGAKARPAAVAALLPLFDLPMPAPHVGVILATGAGLHELFDWVAASAAIHPDRFVRRAAVEGLYQVNQPTLAPAFLLPSIDEDPGVRRYAAVGLAENGLLIGSGRLIRDKDATVARAARQAFARPGQPMLVRDAHRRVMDQSPVFALPDSGSSLMRSATFPRLTAAARELLRSVRPGVVDTAICTLLELGRAPDELRACIPVDAPPSAHRRLALPSAPAPSSPGREPDPALAGRRLLLVGGDGVEGPLLDTLREAGLEVTWLGGFDNGASRLIGAQFDVVLVLTRRVSHAVGEHGVRIGEDCGAVVLHVHTLGQATVLDAAREALA